MHDTRELISIKEAMDCVMAFRPIGEESVPICRALGRILAEDVVAVSDCPSVDSSLKDGYAVISRDIERATKESPVTLRVIDTISAGEKKSLSPVAPGTAVRIMTGSRIPRGATSVLSSEFAAEVSTDTIHALAHAEEGRNILKKGQDIGAGECILEKGSSITPASLGLLAASGVDKVRVYVRPRVAIAATGTELVYPGEPIGPGEVAASNMITLEGILKGMGIQPRCAIFRDNLHRLKQHFQELLEDHHVIFTCGGVLDGDKDFTVKAMEELGVRMLFKRVRIGPGKGICVGVLGDRLIFNLPGGPPSNHVASLVLAVPGVKGLMGAHDPFPPRMDVELKMDLRGQATWTQFVYCILREEEGRITASLVKARSRLMAMAYANGLVELPEGVSSREKGDRSTAWVINWPPQ